MKSLVIAEKPSVARDIARVLHCSQKGNGTLEGKDYVVQDGDVILKPDSQSVYEIKEKKALEGVYCINKGYAVFRKIVMIEQNDEYCIVETGTTYGLSQFDYIVRNGNTVKEDDILFK